MKKLIALLLAVMMLFALCACGDKDDSAKPADDEKEDVKSEENIDKEEEEEEEEDAEFELGTIKGRTYENESMGIGVKLEAGWQLLSEDEMYEMMGIVADMYEGDELHDLILNSGTFYDMMAVTSGVENMNVTVEKQTAAVAAKYSAEDYAEAGKAGLEHAFAAAGYNLISCDIISVDFAGEEHAAIMSHLEGNGVEMYQMAIVFKCGNYFANITISAADEAGLYEIMDMFYAL